MLLRQAGKAEAVIGVRAGLVDALSRETTHFACVRFKAAMFVVRPPILEARTHSDTRDAIPSSLLARFCAGNGFGS